MSAIKKGTLHCRPLIAYTKGDCLRGTWVRKTWDNDFRIEPQYLWSDGKNVYYSLVNEHYVLVGNTWEPKQWQGQQEIRGSDIWTDGTNIYGVNPYDYSHYVLNGDTWEPKQWHGLGESLRFDASYVWGDGTNIYYSDGIEDDEQYVLNGDTWEPKTWNGVKPKGIYVWSDGVSIYVCEFIDHYVLNGDTWEPFERKGIKSTFLHVWSDGRNIFTVGTTVNKVYYLSGDTWTLAPQESPVGFSNQFCEFWTDGVNVYSSGTVTDENGDIITGETYVLVLPPATNYLNAPTSMLLRWLISRRIAGQRGAK